MTATTWVRIPGFPDYEVSNDGQVRSWKTWRGTPGPRILKPVRVRDDRPSVVLYGDGRHARREVHRLVMLAFVGPRPAGMDIRHLDGDVQNNSIGNLAYGTRSENLLDAVRHGTHHFAKRTHCSGGHPYSPENTYRPSIGGRLCRICRRDKKRERRRLASLAKAAA